MHVLSSVARETFALRWRPGGDTAVALLTAVLMAGLYYANTRAQSPVLSLVVFVALTNGVVNVLFPAYYVLVLRREGLDQLGIRGDGGGLPCCCRWPSACSFAPSSKTLWRSSRTPTWCPCYWPTA